MRLKQYSINIPDNVLVDLQHRLEHVRWPDQVVDHPDWSWGTPGSPLRKLMQYWRHEYDWRATEQRLNSYQQTLLTVGDTQIHCFRAGHPDGTPLVLLHGWPDSPLRFEKAIPYLEQDFQLIMPSIPGYGFSERPQSTGYGPNRIADLLVQALAMMGIQRFGVHGGDIGGAIAEAIALHYPDTVIGLHLLDVPFWHRYTVDPTELTPIEQDYFHGMNEWFQHHGAYAAMHRTKPQTLAYSLNDSPLGLAGWMLEKFQAWSDCDGDVWNSFEPGELVDNLMIYWITQTAGSSVRYYRDSALEAKDPAARVHVPTGLSIFPKDIVPAPRAFAERFFNVTHWQQMPRGGHFGPWEQPAAFADQIREFFGSL